MAQCIIVRVPLEICNSRLESPKLTLRPNWKAVLKRMHSRIRALQYGSKTLSTCWKLFECCAEVVECRGNCPLIPTHADVCSSCDVLWYLPLKDIWFFAPTWKLNLLSSESETSPHYTNVFSEYQRSKQTLKTTK